MLESFVGVVFGQSRAVAGDKAKEEVGSDYSAINRGIYGATLPLCFVMLLPTF